MVNKDYGNILVPFDDSKFAQKALDVAKTLAKSFDSTLHIVTVIDISSVVSPGMIRSKERKAWEQIRLSIRQSAKKAVQQKENQCALEKVRTKAWVVEGSAVNEILKIIRQNDIDLVVIGSKGLSGLSKMKALGSVSRKISELSDCPVMIIH